MSNKLVKCSTKEKYESIQNTLSENDIVFIESTKQIISNGIVYNEAVSGTIPGGDGVSPKIIAGTMPSANNFGNWVSLCDNDECALTNIILINHDLTEYSISKALTAGTLKEYDSADTFPVNGIKSTGTGYTLVMIPLLLEFSNCFAYTKSGDTKTSTDMYLGGQTFTPIVRYNNVEYRVYGNFNSGIAVYCEDSEDIKDTLNAEGVAYTD